MAEDHNGKFALMRLTEADQPGVGSSLQETEHCKFNNEVKYPAFAPMQ
jgi:hypothetical protein